MNRLALIFGIALLSRFGATQTATINIDVNHPSHKMARGFYGLMTEEINHSYDGGLLAEQVQNRSFRDSSTAPLHWSALGDGRISLDRSEANVPFLRLETATSGGVANDGYWGVHVTPQTTYNCTIIAKSETPLKGKLNLELIDAKGSVLASSAVGSLTNAWKEVHLSLRTRSTPDSTDNRIALVTDGGGTLDIRYLSVEGPTFNGRKGGTRTDLMKAMAGLRPSFLRLPGGNYLEGNTLSDYFPWEQTLGNSADRPGHACPWGYWSSDGMGLLEYLEWCEDLHMEPLLAVYAGYALNGTHVEGEKLNHFLESALNEIEFVNGPVSTKWGGERARLGHPKPFPLHYIEVGNEDEFDRSGSYEMRFKLFFDAIKARRPDLKVIATKPVKSVVPDLVDDHYYRSGMGNARDEHHYDNLSRSGPKIFVGEWASTEGRPTPTLRAALGDAAWLLGMERNSDLVVLESYAPLLVNVNRGASQWGTNLIGYDASRVALSPAYFVQKLFAQNSGDVVVPVDVKSSAPAQDHGVLGGKVGLGTWETQVEYKDFSVTQEDGTVVQELYSPTDSKWARTRGQWSVDDGVIKQTGQTAGTWLATGDPNWKNYTVHVKARKTGGNEGFLILFNYRTNDDFMWWNVGGWGNSRSAIEFKSSSEPGTVGASSDTVETGRWYDIEVRLKDNVATCLLDGRVVATSKLVAPPTDMIHAGALLDVERHELCLRVVNMSDQPYEAKFDFGPNTLKAGEAIAETMSGSPQDQNSVADPNKVVPKKALWKVKSSGFTHRLEANSVSVVRIPLRK